MGQLRLLKEAVAKSNIRVIMDEKDSDQLAQLEDQEAAKAADGANSSSTTGPVAAAGGASSGASLSTVKVAEMSSCLRLATIDNFQVCHWIQLEAGLIAKDGQAHL